MNNFKKTIKEKIDSGNHRFLTKEIQRDNEFLKFINLETKFLDEKLSYTPTIQQRVWHVYNNSTNINTCRECEGEVNFIKLSRGYSLTCSIICKNGPKTQENIKNSLIEKYGFENVGQIPKVKEKIKNTLNEKYGVNNVMDINDVKISHKKSINKSISERGESIINKRIETVMSEFGVDNISKLKLIKNKKSDTCFKNFGVNNPMQNIDIKNKVKLTNQDRYGGNSPMCSDFVKNKSIKTSLEKYGVPYPMQNEHVFMNNQKSRFKKKEYIFPSGRIELIQGYENKSLDLLICEYEEEDIVVNDLKIMNLIGEIWYTDSLGINRRYFPDIYIISENKIIEVKSSWTYKIDEEINKLKMQAVIDACINFEFNIFES